MTHFCISERKNHRILTLADRRAPPFDEREFIALEIEDIGARDIGRHEIGRKLDAREFAAEHLGQGADEQRLGDARNALNERMVARKNSDERSLDHLVLADDDLARLVPRLGQNFFESFSVHPQTMADAKREFNR